MKNEGERQMISNECWHYLPIEVFVEQKDLSRLPNYRGQLHVIEISRAFVLNLHLLSSHRCIRRDYRCSFFSFIGQRDVCFDHCACCFQIILASCQSWDVPSVLVRKPRSSKLQLPTSATQVFSPCSLFFHFYLF